MDDLPTINIKQNLFDIGAEIDFTIEINNYYFWISFKNYNTKIFDHKIFPTHWWKENFFNKSELSMSIDGDFIMITPLFIEVVGNKMKVNFY